jgi:hypothetical protein
MCYFRVDYYNFWYNYGYEYARYFPAEGQQQIEIKFTGDFRTVQIP